MKPILSVNDKLAINDLINLYVHIIDRQAFSELERIFTADAVFDLSAFQAGAVYQGREQIIMMMQQSTEHPVAHHCSNIVIDPFFAQNKSRPNDQVVVQSKGLGVGRKGRVGSVVYTDIVVHQGDAWRINSRQVQRLSEPGQQV